MTDFEEHKKKLLEKYPDLFPTEAKFWAYLRGCLRRGIWEKSSMKFMHKNSTACAPPKGYTGRGRKGHYCALTGEWVSVSKSESDHIEGHKPLLCEADIIPYIIHLLATEDELQIVDKEAHKIKSYAERMGISFEEAVVQKRIIGMMKDKKKVDRLLAKHNLPCNNDKVRREGLSKLIEEVKI